jgi:hypothetical protein
MKKHLILFLVSIVYLITTTEFKQLLKLPVLVKHFIEHNQKFNQISVLDYIIIHYSEEIINDGDSERDMQLPFKSSSHTMAKTFTATTPRIRVQIMPIAEPLSDEKITILNQTGTLKGYFFRIWNPPQFV